MNENLHSNEFNMTQSSIIANQSMIVDKPKVFKKFEEAMLPQRDYRFISDRCFNPILSSRRNSVLAQKNAMVINF